MFLMDKDFISKGTPEEDVPEDIKVMIAACVIQFTFGQKEYWLPDLEKIIVYPKLFLTRERYGFHAGEAHDDGCMLLSGIAMREGLVNPNSYYHIGLHVAAEYWNLRQAIHHSEFVFEDKDSFLEKLLLIRMFKRDFWRDLTGLHPEIHLTEAAHQTTFDDTNSPNSQKALATKTENDTINNAPPAPLFELAVECFFTKPAEMAAALPDTYIALSLILNQDPLKETYPVLVK
jgi:Mlc titration factor MtfA (ptsG expression regulator)